MYYFITKQLNMRKLIHTLSRYEVLSSSIHAAVNLGIHKIVGDNEACTLQIIHEELLSLKIISNKDIGPLSRLMKFLSCYGIFHVENNKVCHTPLSRALLQPHVLAAFSGLADQEWRKQGDFLNYLSELPPTSPIVTQLTPASVTVDAAQATLRIAADTANDLMIEIANIQLLSRAIYAAARLDLIDFIHRKINTFDALAAATQQNLLALRRLINILAKFKLLQITNSDTLSLTSASIPLMDGGDEVSIKAAAGMANIPWWNAIGYLRYCIETGKPPYNVVNNIAVFDYLESHIEERVRFDRGLSNSDADQDTAVANANFHITNAMTIVDIGGGNGGLITRLVKLNPQLKEATLFDQPKTIEHLRDKIATAQKSDPSNEHAALLSRCILQPGNFLISSIDNGIPRHKDLYIIKGVLHDFTDDNVVTILKNIARAMSDNSVLRIVERYIINDNQPHSNKVGDMQMMAFFAAKERSLEDYQRLAELAGLKLDISSSQPCGNFTIISAKRDLHYTLESTKFGAARSIMLAPPKAKTIATTEPQKNNLDSREIISETSPPHSP